MTNQEQQFDHDFNPDWPAKSMPIRLKNILTQIRNGYGDQPLDVDAFGSVIEPYQPMPQQYFNGQSEEELRQTI